MDAQRELAQSASEKRVALQAHLERLRELARNEHRSRNSAGMEREHAQLLAYVSEARHWLAQTDEPVKEKPDDPRLPSEPGATGGVTSAGRGRGLDPKSQLIKANWMNESSLRSPLRPRSRMWSSTSRASPNRPISLQAFLSTLIQSGSWRPKDR